jgi:hypothetical protein
MSTKPHNRELDERGTTPQQALAMLQMLRDKAFDGSDEKLSLAIGRTPEELFDIMHGNAEFDDGLIIKTRGLAQQRGVEFE